MVEPVLRRYLSTSDPLARYADPLDDPALAASRYAAT